MEKLLTEFSNVKVLVFGDVMLDQYWLGNVSRISPEAPVPVVNLLEERLVVGGAANVAANISGLGAKPYLIGVLGNDEEGQKFTNSLAENHISNEHMVVLERKTTVKTRVVASNQQIVRIDQEISKNLKDAEEKIVWDQIKKAIDDVHIIVISDYAKGVVTESLCLNLIKLAKEKKKLIIVDPKGTNFTKYQSATILTPNHKEAIESSKSDFTSFDKIGEKLLKKLDLEALIITKGKEGMSLYRKDKSIRELKASARKVYDVTGAGDTVIATLAVAIGAEMDFVSAAKLANLSAGLVVEQVGTTSIKLNQLRAVVSDI